MGNHHFLCIASGLVVCNTANAPIVHGGFRTRVAAESKLHARIGHLFRACTFSHRARHRFLASHFPNVTVVLSMERSRFTHTSLGGVTIINNKSGIIGRCATIHVTHRINKHNVTSINLINAETPTGRVPGSLRVQTKPRRKREYQYEAQPLNYPPRKTKDCKTVCSHSISNN